MQEQLTLPIRKTCLAVLVFSSIFLTIFYYDSSILDYHFKFQSQDALFLDSRFLVSSPKCKILDLDPFGKDSKKYYRHEKYKPCRKLPLLTYTSKIDNNAFLHIDNEIVPSYAKGGVSCCYSTVRRYVHNDNDLMISACQNFQNNVSIQTDPVLVKCRNSRQKQVYENVHVAVTAADDIQKKLNSSHFSKKPLSVLFIGIDSISRLNFIRSLPNTFNYVEDHGWLPLKGYNKIDDNTFPNLMAILTGFNQSYAYNVCNPKEEGKLDKCPMLWYDFRNFGYITAYAEDEGSINTFNYLKKGFRTPPTDYYFRPYVLASEQLKKVMRDNMAYCTGPETAGERIMNIARDFALTYKQYPSFGFFWMNSFSHNKLSSPSGMDLKVKRLLEDLENELENTIVIFLSDHGMRFGDFRLTDVGWQEERLPFIYVLFPKWFKRKFSKEYYNFKNNFNKLVCPYDLHVTLKHILVLSGYNYSVTQSDACPKCKSLFEEIESDRSCEDAGIAQHWCTCNGYVTKNLDRDQQNTFSKYVLDKINTLIASKHGDKHCAKYSLNQVLNTKISQRLNYKNETYLLMKLKTHPKAVFETTLKFESDISSNFSLSGDISRLDSYSDHSKCVSDAYLKKYCYCR